MSKKLYKVAPGPKGSLLLGVLPEIFKIGFHNMYIKMWKQYGDIVRFKLGPQTFHLIVRPEHIKHVLMTNKDNYYKGPSYSRIKLLIGNGLVTSEGELWQKQRKLIRPSFTANNVKNFHNVMVEITDDLIQEWQKLADKAVIEINQQMLRLTMDIITRSMFNMKFKEDAADIGEIFNKAFELIVKKTMKVFNLPLFIPTYDNREFKKSMHKIEKLINKFIAQGRMRKEQSPDLLSALIKARDEDSGVGMSEQQLMDEVMTIFLAGHETVTQLLSFAFFALGEHPKIEEKVAKEVKDVLGDRLPTIDDIVNLKYTRMVIHETLRLFPPAGSLAKDVLNDDEIGGFHIPGGSSVFVIQYITQRHPDFWENPENFDPKKFAGLKVTDHLNYSYLPFGGGSRICLGNHFAILEATTILAMIIQRFKLTLVPGHPVVPEVTLTLRPKYGVKMNISRR